MLNVAIKQRLSPKENRWIAKTSWKAFSLVILNEYFSDESGLYFIITDWPSTIMHESIISHFVTLKFEYNCDTDLFRGFSNPIRSRLEVLEYPRIDR